MDNVRILARACEKTLDMSTLLALYDAMHEAGLGELADFHFLRGDGSVQHCKYRADRCSLYRILQTVTNEELVEMNARIHEQHGALINEVRKGETHE